MPIDEEPYTTARPPLTPEQRAIGRHVAALVEDGATVQTGIGAIPDAELSRALPEALPERRQAMNLRVHGERRSNRGARRGAVERALIALETFTGLTAVAGGVVLMARPDGSLMQMAPSALEALAHNSPFPDFFLPGLALAVIVGGGMLGAATLLVQHRPYAFEMAMVAGAALVLFEIVEFAAIGFMPLQVFEGVVGTAVLGMEARRWWVELPRRQHPLRRGIA